MLIRGAIGLGKTRISLQAEIAKAFKVREKFTLCIPASGKKGSMIVGETTYRSPFLTARFIRIPVDTIGNTQIANLTDEYFIGLKSIRVGSKPLSLNKTLLSIDTTTGGGGTSIQTVRPFTSLEKSIYAALVEEFVSAAEAMNITSVESVAPFGACFDGKTIGWSQTGPVVPTVDFVLTKNVYWRMYGSNSMVSIGDVLCLAFVEEEVPVVGPATSVVVGGRQMENYLLEFDVGESRLKFSPSLLLGGTSCSQFGA